MCELFGLSSRLPTTVTLSMRLLARRGSRAMRLGDGWGVAFHTGDDALLIKQAEPANESAWVDFLETRQIRSHIALAYPPRHSGRGVLAQHAALRS
jgi:glutamine amidotransferase